MAMKRCPICGEKYSDTYKSCPFCEESEALRNGETHHRRGGHRVAQSGPNLLSPILILVVLILAGGLVYLLFGNVIAEKLGIEEPLETPAASVSEPSVSSGGKSASKGGANPTGQAPDTAVALDKDDFTLDAGETYTLKASSGSGDYTWKSDDDGIASVSDTGIVTAVSSGNTTITVSDGYTTAQCIVRVKGTSVGTTSPGSGSIALSSTDVSIAVGESFPLAVTGTSSAASFAVENNSIASVTAGGKVTGKASGRTKVTATVDGKVLTCIVRVK